MKGLDLGLTGGHLSVWSFKRWIVRVWTGFMAGSCEHSNETVMKVP